MEPRGLVVVVFIIKNHPIEILDLAERVQQTLGRGLFSSFRLFLCDRGRTWFYGSVVVVVVSL